jgi:carboxymethylenebutenolidase
MAAEGYVALAIDLYRGNLAASSDEAHQLMRGVPEDRARRDLRSAFAYLRGRPDVDSARIGTIGWCMGGGYALEAAVSIPGLKTAVVCYGRLVTDSALIAGMNAAVLGVFGGKDRGISVESVEQFRAAAGSVGKSVETTIFPEAGHAFMNPGNASAYRGADADSAWAVIMDFMHEALKGAK